MSRRRKTTEEYIKECKEHGFDLPIENYKGSMNKINHKCSKGHIYKQTPHTHLNGRGCKLCLANKLSDERRKTPEQYVKECMDKGYDLPIEDYKGNKVKIKHKCSRGHVYLQTPHNHLKGQGCRICSNDNKKKTPQDYLKECKEKGYDLPIEDYINDNTKINHKCKQGHVYPQRPSVHLQGKGCLICYGSKKKTPEDYLKECKENGLDLPIEDYVDNKTKINHMCSKGHIYPQRPNQHLQGYGCPTCNESKGEKFIRNYLDKHCIKYISQKTFKGLKDKQSLSYDFYLSDSNILIEYQGQQHFESVSFNGKDYSDLDKQKYHDRLKQRFAKDNGYRLLRPTYKTNTQEKINKYLDRYLVKRLDK